MLASLLRRALRETLSRLTPGHRADALFRAAQASASSGKHDAAIGLLEQALELAPRFAAAWTKLGVARLETGLVEEAIAAFRGALDCAPGDPVARQNLAYALVLRSESPAELLAEHCACAARLEAGLAPPAPFDNDRRSERRLRVGYVSGDLATHAVTLFMEPILSGHDPAACEVHVYDNRVGGDATTARLKSLAPRWRNVAGCDDAEMERIVRNDRIDILVDLSGYTARTRLGAFARRCAPLQVTYLGYLATTGLSAMDYRLTDAIADPPGETEGEYRETPLRLPGCLWCYRPPLASLATRRQPRSGVTFGSLNNSRKLTGRMLRLWAEILRRTPDAALVIACLPEGRLRHRVLAELAAAGIDSARIECLPWMKPDDFAALHCRIDVALDTNPCGGGTTTIEALWHGVPVVSLTGNTFPGRVGRSILGHAGLPELAAASERAYVETAVGLASDRERLARLHAEIPERLRASSIMDESRFVRGLEQAYRAIWRSFCATDSTKVASVT